MFVGVYWVGSSALVVICAFYEFWLLVCLFVGLWFMIDLCH